MEEQNQNEMSVDGQKPSVLQIFKAVDFELVSFRTLFGIIFLLPLFALPFGIFAVDFNKAMFLYLGVALASICFLIARVYKGSILIPKSFILASLFLTVPAWLASSIFSGNIALSLFGAGFETGTFSFFLFLSMIAFLISVLFRSARHIALLYKGIFISATILFVIQFLHTGFGIALPPWNMFQGVLASVLGNWNDLGIFFGLIAIVSLSSLEFGGGNRRERIFLRAMLGMSLVAVFFVNFSTLHYVLGFSVLALLVYRIVNPPYFEGSSHRGNVDFLNASFFVFLAIVVFSFAHEWTGVLINSLGIQFTQVYPSWTATFGVIKGALLANPFFGSGPNTFSYDWLLFKPDAISNTIFWDTQFQSGVGRLPSMVAETGILGGATLMIFISSLLYAGKTVVSYKEHRLERMLLVSSFLGSVYLWIFTIVYSPGFLIFIFAGIFTGIFAASLGIAQKVKMAEFSFTKGTKKGFALYLFAMTVVLGFVYSFYLFGSKYFAGYFYTIALEEASIRSDIEKADMYLQRAVWLDPQDIYFRSGAEIGLLRLGQLISLSGKAKVVSDIEKTQFRDTLSATVQNAKNATIANPLDPQNWMELGKVYETILQFDPEEFKSSAIFAYGEALRVSPHNPSPFVALARIELQAGNTDGALHYLNKSLKIKSDFVAGHMMLAQIAVAEGKLREAISELDRAVSANPNNPENIYIVLRIGVLYYQDGDYEKAQSIFEKLVKLDPNFVDARYSLGLLYDKKGMFTQATAQFEELSKLIPENSEIQKILGNLRAGRGAFGNDLTPPPLPEEPIKKPTKR